MDLAEKFDYLMDVIDRWTEATNDRKAGSFKNLREGMWMREVAVTPSCSVNIPSLKTYFAIEVLNIYPSHSQSKISYLNIRRCLAGDAVKKYSFDFTELEKCFSPEANREALKSSQLSTSLNTTMETGDLGDVSPSPYLLGKIQQVFRRKLGKYWNMCDPNTRSSFCGMGKRQKWRQRVCTPPRKVKNDDWGENPKDDRDDELDEEKLMRQRQNGYMECLVALALHEIFTRECDYRYVQLQKRCERNHSLAEEIKEKLDSFPELCSKSSESQEARLLEQGTDIVQKLTEYMEGIADYMVLLPLYLEHVVGVEAEMLIVTILESRNLGDVKADIRLQRRLKKYLKAINGREMESFTRYDKNKSKIYRQLEAYIEDVFFRYMEQASIPAGQNVSDAVNTYLKIVGEKKYGSEQMNMLWNAQCVLVRLWRRRR